MVDVCYVPRERRELINDGVYLISFEVLRRVFVETHTEIVFLEHLFFFVILDKKYTQ